VVSHGYRQAPVERSDPTVGHKSPPVLAEGHGPVAGRVVERWPDGPACVYVPHAGGAGPDGGQSEAPIRAKNGSRDLAAIRANNGGRDLRWVPERPPDRFARGGVPKLGDTVSASRQERAAVRVQCHRIDTMSV